MKVVIHPIADNRLSPLADGQLELEDAIVRARWDDSDPGVGVAVIDEHGREIVSPAKFEEPADIEAGQDMMAILEARITKRLLAQAGIRDGEVLDETEDEANDFAVGDDINYVSGFEVEMADEYPQMPTPGPRPGREPGDLGVDEARGEGGSDDEYEAAASEAVPEPERPVVEERGAGSARGDNASGTRDKLRPEKSKAVSKGTRAPSVGR